MEENDKSDTMEMDKLASINSLSSQTDDVAVSRMHYEDTSFAHAAPQKIMSSSKSSIAKIYPSLDELMKSYPNADTDFASEPDILMTRSDVIQSRPIMPPVIEETPSFVRNDRQIRSTYPELKSKAVSYQLSAPALELANPQIDDRLITEKPAVSTKPIVDFYAGWQDYNLIDGSPRLRSSRVHTEYQTPVVKRWLKSVLLDTTPALIPVPVSIIPSAQLDEEPLIHIEQQPLPQEMTPVKPEPVKTATESSQHRFFKSNEPNSSVIADVAKDTVAAKKKKREQTATTKRMLVAS